HEANGVVGVREAAACAVGELVELPVEAVVLHLLRRGVARAFGAAEHRAERAPALVIRGRRHVRRGAALVLRRVQPEVLDARAARGELRLEAIAADATQ